MHWVIYGDIDAFTISLLLLFCFKKRITSAIVNSLNFVLAAVVCSCFSFVMRFFDFVLAAILYRDGDGDF